MILLMLRAPLGAYAGNLPDSGRSIGGALDGSTSQIGQFRPFTKRESRDTFASFQTAVGGDRPSTASRLARAE